MHHPKEAVIDGVKFVLIPEELLNVIKDYFTLQVEPAPAFMPIEEIMRQLEAL